ncbi:MAG: class IV adenylate cyclase [bacterium]
MYEVEVKMHLNNREAVIKKLKDLGCIFGEVLHQIDYIFIPEEVSFPPPLDVPVLRVRKENEKYFFTMKISMSNRQDCIEKELEIFEGEKMLEILKFLKYKQVPVVDKKRIKTKIREIEVVLDEVVGLGEFLEAEKIVHTHDGEERKKIQEELLSFLETLGIKREDQIVNGKYDIMLYEKYEI